MNWILLLDKFNKIYQPINTRLAIKPWNNTKNRLFFIAYLFCLITPALAQTLPKPDGFWFRLSGQTTEHYGQSAVARVRIYNPNTGKSIYSDSSGNFSLVLEDKDSLIFTHLNYKSYRYLKDIRRVGNDYIVVQMSPKNYQFAPVQVFATRRKLTSSMVRPEYHLQLAYEQNLMANPPPSEIEAGFMNPISLLYNQFSKRAKDNRKLQKLLLEYHLKSMVDREFNEKKTFELTGLSDPEELEKFTRYCYLRLGDEFILQSNEYELNAAILKNYDTWKRLNSYDNY